MFLIALRIALYDMHLQALCIVSVLTIIRRLYELNDTVILHFSVAQNSEDWHKSKA